MANSNVDFYSLDMLAEVAASTKKCETDSSFERLPRSANIASEIHKTRSTSSSKVNVEASCSFKQPDPSSDRMNLYEIKALSDKHLIDMFSEVDCDEIRRTYVYHCFLMPDRCALAFKSFGIEERARAQMKTHLQDHLKRLIQVNDTCFTAKPLYDFRKKRVQDVGAKNSRKKKKVEGSSKKKKITAAQEVPQDNGNVKSNKLKKASSKKKSPPSSNSLLKTSNKEREEIATTSHSNLNMEISRSDKKSLRRTKKSPIKKKNMSKQKRRPNRESKENGSYDKYKFLRCNDFKKGFFELEAPSTYHDHTYTSAAGVTLDYDFHPPKEIPHKKHICIEPPLTINSPPYPFIYVPLLPYIAAIEEVAENTKTACGKCPDLYHYGINEKSLKKQKKAVSSKVYYQCYKFNGQEIKSFQANDTPFCDNESDPDSKCHVKLKKTPLTGEDFARSRYPERFVEKMKTEPC